MAFSTSHEQSPEPTAILERVTRNDRTAVRECLERYGGWVWVLSRKCTNTESEAEELCFEIFRDIWRYSYRFSQSGLEEFVFIALIARRRIRDQRTAERLNVKPDNQFFKFFVNYTRNEA